MFDKRLFSLVPGVMRHIAANVALQWLALLANVVLFVSVGGLLQSVLAGDAAGIDLVRTLLTAVVAVAVRLVCQAQATKQGLAASALAKQRVRTLVYDKLVRMGPSYRETVATSEATQLCVEGVEQLEAYFGNYLPQLFYSLIASVTLFFCLAPLCTPAAVVLLCCVPLIPISLMAVMKIAKRIMGDYWHSYTDLGALFLESIQGLTTLKVFGADEGRHRRMNEEAEKFRKATMRLLTMQLNSVIVMDIFAFAGAAAGIVVMLDSYAAGTVTFAGAFAFVFLAADFFIPLRTLGSFFHTATGGMAAAERMYRIIDAPEPACGTQAVTCASVGIECRNVSYSYDGTRTVLQDADFTARPGGFVGITGASGSGKSTLAGILTGANRSYTGSVTIGGIDLRDISAESLRETVTYVGFRSFLFAGTVRSNLLMARPGASDDELWEALSRCRIDDFVRRSGGLDAPVSAEGTNLSGGQRQRLAMARALLHDTPVYIFDEATSNIDADSEAAIIDAVAELARIKTVVMVSHRLAALRGCDKVYVFEAGRVVQTGTHEELAGQDGPYARLWARQAELEDFSARSGEGAGTQVSEQMHQAAEDADVKVGEQVCQVTEGASAVAGGQACRATEDAGAAVSEKTRSAAEGHASKPVSAPREVGDDAPSQQTAAGVGATAPKRGKVRIMLELVKLTRPLLGVLACAVVLGVAGFLAAIGITVLATSALLDLEGQAHWIAAGVAAVAAVMCGVARGPLRYAEQLCNHYLAFRVLALVRDKVFAAMRRLAPAKLEGKEKGDLVSLVTADIELLEVFYAHTLSPAAIALAVSIIVLVFIGLQAPQLVGFAAFGFICVGVVVPWCSSRYTATGGLELRQQVGKMNSFVLDSLRGLSETLQFGAQKQRARELDERMASLACTERKLKGRSANALAISGAVVLALDVAMIGLAMMFVMQGTLEFGRAVMAAGTFMASFGPLLAVAALGSTLQQTLAAGSRVLDLLEEAPQTPEVTDGVNVDAFEGMAMREVSFAYRDKKVLSNIDVDIRPGRVVRIAGPSGMGKSTLLKLLMRFWDPQSGRVTISGLDLRDVNTASLRSQQGLMEQDTFLFATTIRENLLVAKADASDEELMAALEKAALRELVERLPQGLDTQLAELGDSLSGGERQRLGLARVFLQDAPLLLLDEPTSNLDALSEASVLKALQENRGDKTVVIVTHRASAGAIADDTYTLSNGTFV